MKVVRGTSVPFVPASHEDPRHPGTLKRVLLTAQAPTRAMEADAAAVGIWANEYTGRKHPRLQILTLAELFQGRWPDIPWVDASVAKAAKREDTGKQGTLL